MNNNNIVRIGVALKWRNTYDPEKIYYQENIVTACGCVFRCKALQTQGEVPVHSIDEDGHIGFVNEDVWDVVVDMTYYYNFCIDTNNFVQETLEYVKKLDEELQRQNREIETIKAQHKEDVELLTGMLVDLEEKHDADVKAIDERITEDEKKHEADVENINATIEELELQHDEDVEALSERIDANKSAIEDLNKQVESEIIKNSQEHDKFQANIDEINKHLDTTDQNTSDNANKIADNLSRINANTDKINDVIKQEDAKHAEIEQTISNIQIEQVEQNERLDGLDTSVEELEATVEEQQRIIEEQQTKIDALQESSYLPETGRWNNELFWDDDALWMNVTLSEQMMMGIPVISYDPTTQTVFI